MKKSTFFFILFFATLLFARNAGAQTYTVGSGGNYTTLKLAFDAVNAGSITGAITLQVVSSTTEAASAVLNASGSGSASYTSVTIYPTGAGYSISGSLATPLIDLNGADNVIIDGRVNATGSTKDLVITNTSTSGTAGTSTIRFINSAENNTVKYCTIKGSETVAASGVIFFSTASSGNGNDGNSIDNNNLTCSADASRPVNAIYSLGSGGYENSGNTISNNNIYNLFSRGIDATNIIYLSSYSTSWTISGNSFYETTSFVPSRTAEFDVIKIDNSSGTGFTITGNYIGGSAPSCGGSAWTKTSRDNTFYAIYLNAGTIAASSIQNNTIQNFAWSNSAKSPWTGIHLAGGDVNVGTLSANTIGAATGTGSITLTSGDTPAALYGINIASSGTVNCQNNSIGSITTAALSSSIAITIYAIKNANVAGTTTLSNNIIGSTTTANSINASAISGPGWPQGVYGIYSEGSGNVTISGNTIAKLTNASTYIEAQAGETHGIKVKNSGTNTISNNTIYDLTAAGGIGGDNAQPNSPAVGGIVFDYNNAATQSITGNTIHNLSNTAALFSGRVTGITYTNYSGNGTISGNFINGLSEIDASTIKAGIVGIYIQGNITCSNNIISLGENTATTIYGIYSTAGYHPNLYFNTVYVGGILGSGTTNKSYALYFFVNSGTYNIRNNIFENTRSTTAGVSLHYAVYIPSPGSSGLTLDYNNYYASGIGGVLGYYNSADVTSLPLIAGFDLGSQAVNPLFASPGGTSALNYVPANNGLCGIAGTGITTDYSSVSRSDPPTMGAFEVPLTSNVEVWIGTKQASYFTLKAAFDKINDGTHSGGAIEIRIAGNTLPETASAVLNASGTGAASYSSVTIYPTVSGINIRGNLSAPLIDLNGADNVTIDGRVNATGNTKDMVIANLSISATAGTSTIRFINSAENNTVKYCTIKGSETVAASGVIFFSTASSGNGNDSNSIDNNNITCSADASRPLNAIYSLGSVGYENSGNTISNNNIYNFLSRSTASQGIYLYSYTTAWTISGNSFYETASFAPTADVTYYPIQIYNLSGTGFSVTGNFIGGNAPLCGGSAWTKTNAKANTFTALYLAAGTGTASSIQNNTIQNFSWSNSSYPDWTGISVPGGNVNIGTNTGNTIGSSTGTGSVTITSSTNSSKVLGIDISSPGTVDCRNNTIGSITTYNTSTFASNIYAINKTTSSGTLTISSNTIGSTITANSINASSPSTSGAQSVVGINLDCTSATLTITGNTIANMTNGTINATGGTVGIVNGITARGGTNTISGNTIYNLTIANANTSATYQASVSGIALYYATAAAQTISGNTIYNLSNTYSSFAGSVIGLYYSGPTIASTLARNFIHGLSATGASSTTATITGIQIAGGASTYSNNIISLGGNTKTTLYGIYVSGALYDDNNFYFNTVFIGGALVSGSTNKSYALYSAVTTNTRDFRNNIFVNTRSTTSGTSLHYAACFAYASSANLRLDYNDYYAPGTGGVLGYYNGADVTSLPLIPGFDIMSGAIDPVFANPGGTTATDYKPSSGSLEGVSGTGITTDYSGTTRATFPTMGAWETTGLPTARVEVWQGILQASYFTLKGAFDKINDGTHTGALEIRITGKVIEQASAMLNASGSGSASYSSLTIYPTVTGCVVAGELAAPLIDLNGADNVTIDGRVNATGSTKDLVICNFSTSATAGTSTLRFINDATQNTVKYCTIRGSETDPSGSSGILFFSTTTGTTGNDGNLIDNNNITNAGNANRPINAVFSSGTSAKENSGITISNNNIYDFLKTAAPFYSNGISLGSNTTAWTISGNSFYETSPFATTASVTFNVIKIDYVSGTAGTGFVISGNFIGGSTSGCGGTAWTKTGTDNIFYGIYLNVGTGVASSVQNNTIKNFSWDNYYSTAWTAIHIQGGAVNVGTNAANTIGATSGTGSIMVIGEMYIGTIVYGINIASSGTVDCRNNIIGSITAAPLPALSGNIYGINKSASGGTTTISNNTIGSTTTAGSINASSGSTGNAQSVYGINSAGTGTVIITGNTIAKLTNGTTNATAATAGLVNGITGTGGTNTISSNTIYDLTIANANAATTYQASVSGIALNYTTAAVQTISGNTIYNLSNTYSSFAGNVIGLYYNGSTTASTVSGNFIYSLSVTGASSTSASIYGIKIDAGATTFSNNIITLGGNTKTTLYGIYETGAAGNNNNLWFNTVYLNGTLAAGSPNWSYALYSAVTTNTRDFRNNLFVNARSTTGGTNRHYAAAFAYASSANLTLDNNDYYAPGTGGVLGIFNSTNLTTLPLIAGQDLGSWNIDPLFANAGGTNAVDYKTSSNTLWGITIAGVTSDYAGTTRATTPTIGAYEGTLGNIVEVYKTGAFQAAYSNIKAAFDNINNGTHTGDVVIKLNGSTTEPVAAVLNASGSGAASYTSVTIYPTVTGRGIGGNLASPLIDLNGADNVTIDGRVNASGSAKDLVISNNSTSASAGTSSIRFINDATTNTVKYCTLRGSETNTASGIIFFSTTTGTTGNDGNIIDNNNITCSGDANRPLNAIYSLGTPAKTNSENTISNNNIYNFLSRGSDSQGIFLSSNTTAWVLSGNSLYETASFVQTAAPHYYPIRIDNASGTGFSVTGNFIGGNAPLCGGSAWTKSTNFNSAFTAIYLAVGTGTASSIQNNTIKNFSWSNDFPQTWTGIHLAAGDVDVGTSTVNTIGAATGNGSITVTLTGGASGAIVYGINIASTGTVDCRNNIMGSITVANSAATLATNFYGICKTATAGTTTISNNTIGSTTTAGSINASSGSTGTAQSVYGINSAGTGIVIISGNTIAKLTNGTTCATAATAGLVNGITATGGTNTISGNTIYDLTIANANTAATYQASVSGISLNYTTSAAQTISGNTIYNLSNTYSSFAGNDIGLYYNGSTTASTVSGNFIHSLSVTGASSATANIYGIKIAGGATTYSNNIISLGGNTATTLTGICETGMAGNNNNLYFNTVYLSGILAPGSTNKSYALYSAVTTNTRDFRNNIFDNARSTTSGTNLHYAACFAYASSANLMLDYNDYFAPGTGGVLGNYNGIDVNAVPLISGMDGNSLNTDPTFTNAGSTVATDYKIGINLTGVGGTGITIDFGLFSRDNPPSMGAWEHLIMRFTVSGSTSGDGEYHSLTNASGVFTALNAYSQAGNIIVITVSNSSASETGVNSLNAGTWTSLTIYPAVTGINISGNVDGPLLSLNGAGNVTIDGRVNATGSTKDLVITNLSAGSSASAVQFTNAALNNVIKYCSVAGDLNVSGASSATVDGEMSVGGNLTSEGGSNLLNAETGHLTVSGSVNINP